MFITKRQKNTTWIVFGIYLFLLIWLVMFKFSTNLSDLSYFRNVNFIPFGQSMRVNGRIYLNELFLNLLVFVPLGVYISTFKQEWFFLLKIIPCFLLSLLFEVLQYIFAIGASDITDILNNTLGGITGIIICYIFRKIWKEKYISIVNGIGIFVEALAVLLLGTLILSN